MIVFKAMSYIQVSEVVAARPAEIFRQFNDLAKVAHFFRPDLEFNWLSIPERLESGSEIRCEISKWGVSTYVKYRVAEWRRNQCICIKQVEGLFRKWSQTWRLDEHSVDHTLVTESIEYQLPLGILGHLADDLFLRAELERQAEGRLLRLQAAFQGAGPAREPDIANNP